VGCGWVVAAYGEYEVVFVVAERVSATVVDKGMSEALTEADWHW